MILIQLVLIVGFMAFLIRVLMNPASHQVRAMTKILASLFVLIAILTVIFPNTTTTIAHWLGVNRGADLLLYILTLAFIFEMFNSYIREKRLQENVILLARRIAIIEANQRKPKARQ
jgi:hypothetical protein